MDHTEITPTWATVELPILRAIISAEHSDEDLNDAARGAAAELTDRRFSAVMQSLHDAEYLDVLMIDVAEEPRPIFFQVNRVLPDARRAVGQWPTADGLATALADAFEQAADAEDDAERKLSYREAAKAVLTGVATTAITKFIGL